MLRGATGTKGAEVNGTYVLTAERLNDKSVYAKEGDADIWLLMRKDGTWAGGATTKDLTDNSSYAGYNPSESGCAHPAASKKWQDKVSIMVRSHKFLTVSNEAPLILAHYSPQPIT